MKMKKNAIFAAAAALALAACGADETCLGKETGARLENSASPAGETLDCGWNPSVKRRLDELIERNRGNPDAYAVFDFDYTTAIGDLSYLCMWRLLETLDFKAGDLGALLKPGMPQRHYAEIDAIAALAAKLKAMRLKGDETAARPEWRDLAGRYWALYRALFQEIGHDEAVKWRVRLFKGFTPDEMRGLAKDAISAALRREGLWRDPAAPKEKRGFAIPTEIKQLFRDLLEAGIAVYIVSGSIRETILAATGGDFGLDFDPGCVFGSVFKLDADGRYLSETDDDSVKPWHKPEFIMKHIAPRHHGAEPVLTAGDSTGDYTMLTEFKDLQLALVFMRNWREQTMYDLVASGGRVVAQGRDEVRGVLIPEQKSIEPEPLR